MTEVNYVLSKMRVLMAWIVSGVYSAIEWIMIGIFDIADLQASPSLAGDIRTKIYVFLGIIMMFKLIVTMIKYMMNPDTMSDTKGNSGVGKLFARIAGMLVLLMILPNLFGVLNKVQTSFLPVIPRVLFGTGSDYASEDSTLRDEEVINNANNMAVGLLGAFYRPYCGQNECSSDGATISAITSIDDMNNTIEDSVETVVDGEAVEVYAYEFTAGGFIALAIGIVAVIILFKITVDVAIRVFKMFILEVIAPIPIISYMDPKSSKDGAFASWVKQLTSTFLDIFVRLGVIYLVLFFMQHYVNDDLFVNLNLTGVRALYLKIFLYIALLMFAKDAPNFIKDALGIKHDKSTAGVLAGITGAITGTATGAVSGLISGKGLSGMATGAVTGLQTGYQAGATGKKASAWQAAGDAAIQARTGDKNAKSGFLAAIQVSTQGKAVKTGAKRRGLTADTLKTAKNNMLSAAAEATSAADEYNEAINLGIFDPATSTYRKATTAEIEALRIKKDAAASSSAIASKNYEKANKAADQYGINQSWAADIDADKKKAKKDYRKGKISKVERDKRSKFDPNKRS